MGSGTTIPLGRASRRASRDQPGRRSGNAPAPCGAAVPIRSCSRWGLPCRPRCRGRGALLPHRFALARGLPCGACAGGLFSVALSLGSPPPDVIRHRIPVEPGLSSAALRDSGRPAVWRCERWLRSRLRVKARRQQSCGSIEGRQRDRQVNAGKGQRAAGSNQFGLFRPHPVGIAAQQFSFDARAVDHEQFSHGGDRRVGPDIGAGVRFVAGRRAPPPAALVPTPSGRATAWRRSRRDPGPGSSDPRVLAGRCRVLRSHGIDCAAQADDRAGDRLVRPGLRRVSRCQVPWPRGLPSINCHPRP